MTETAARAVARGRRDRRRAIPRSCTRTAMSDAARSRLVTYSTKPRGGVVHTLALAEALHAPPACPCTSWRSATPGSGFFRPTRRSPYTIVPAPPPADDPRRAGLRLRRRARARAAARSRRRFASRAHPGLHLGPRGRAGPRRAAPGSAVVAHRAPRRRLHDPGADRLPAPGHRSSPTAVLVVSERLAGDRCARVRRRAREVVHNGVDVARFAPIRDPGRRPAARPGRGRGPVRSSSRSAGSSRARAASRCSRRSPALSASDGSGARCWRSSAATRSRTTSEYRDGRWSALARARPARSGDDVVLLGTVPDAETAPAGTHAADALAFPSVKEGWGLAVLEAMSAELPVVATDLPVFREYLVPDRDALMPPVGDVPALAGALHAVATDARPARRPRRRRSAGRRAVQLAGLRRGASGRLLGLLPASSVSRRRAAAGPVPAGRGGSAGRCDATTIRHDSVV